VKQIERVLADERVKIDELDTLTGHSPFMLAAMNGHQVANIVLELCWSGV
jgi:hypothetical protein